MDAGRHLSLSASELVCNPLHADDFLLLASDLILQVVLLPGIPVAECNCKSESSSIKAEQARLMLKSCVVEINDNRR